MREINVFVSYSHKDELWVSNEKYDLIRSFDDFFKSNIEDCNIKFWYDHALSESPGRVWEDSIKQNIEKAHFAILLISQNFVSSSFIKAKELPLIKGKMDRNELSIIPILIGNVDWEAVTENFQWLINTQILPSTDTPLIKLAENNADWDEAKMKIIKGISKTFKNFINSKFCNSRNNNSTLTEELKKTSENLLRIVPKKNWCFRVYS